MIYMKLIHPYLAPFIEPAIDRVVALIWGPQAVQRGCPIKPKSGSSKTINREVTAFGEGDSVSTSTQDDSSKSKED